MKFCRSISEFDRIFYDPISNLFLVNGKTALEEVWEWSTKYKMPLNKLK